MLIRFWFGYLNIGPNIGTVHPYDMAATLCLGWRGDVPKGEQQWHRIWRVSWNWLPTRFYRRTNIGKGIDSSRWTGRERRLVGFGAWQREYWHHRSSNRSKMYVYLTGSKERVGEHSIYVSPAATGVHFGKAKEDAPSEWKDVDGVTPRQLVVKFINGRASVESNLGEWLIANKIAQRSNSIIKAQTGALLGNLANVIAGR